MTTIGKMISDGGGGIKIHYESIISPYKGKNIDSINFSEVEASINKTPLDSLSKKRLRNLLFAWRFGSVFAKSFKLPTAPPRKTSILPVKKSVNMKKKNTTTTTTITITTTTKNPAVLEEELAKIALKLKESRHNVMMTQKNRGFKRPPQHLHHHTSSKAIKSKEDIARDRLRQKEMLDRMVPNFETNDDVRYIDYTPYPMERLGLFRKPDEDFEEYQISDLEEGEIV